jgi:hypothetical protein
MALPPAARAEEVTVEARPSRRVVLVASAAAIPLLASACRGVQVLGSPPPPAPDVRQLRTAIDAERQLIAEYRSAIPRAATDASASAALAGLLAEHEQHLAQLNSRLLVPDGSADSTAPRSGGGSGAPASVPAGLPAALAALAAAEQAACQRLATQLLDMPASLAQLLASISASEATHVPVLDALRRSA